MVCKICSYDKDKHDSIQKLISDGCRPVDIIREFPEISYANITNHKNHMNKSNIQNMQQILDNSMSADNVQKMKADNVGDLLRLASYLEAHPEGDNSMNQFRSEFEFRLSSLEHILEFFHLTSDYEPDEVNGLSREENEMMGKRSILSVVRTCMTCDLEDGRIPIGDIMSSILLLDDGIKTSTRIWD